MQFRFLVASTVGKMMHPHTLILLRCTLRGTMRNIISSISYSSWRIEQRYKLECTKTRKTIQANICFEDFAYLRFLHRGPLTLMKGEENEVMSLEVIIMSFTTETFVNISGSKLFQQPVGALSKRGGSLSIMLRKCSLALAV